VKRFSLKISGPAGTGIMQAGETLSKALNRLGFFTLVYPEYPSRIRGGDNHVQVIFSEEKYLAPQERVDLLLAFNPALLLTHTNEVTDNGERFEATKIGLTEIAQKLGNPMVINTAGLGFLWGILGFNLKVLLKQIEEDFKDKEKVREINIKAAETGYEISKTKRKSPLISLRINNQKIINLTGNEALTEGILKAECDFAAIYPMTPINEILKLLAKSKVKLFRPEDEIAGMMAALGAAYAGGRAMVATSGGGFSLMVEGLGMAGIAEIPVVIVLGQRTGPSTGMATFSSQSDLNFVLYAGHGEFPRIILTPGDLEESARLGAEAFSLAEQYQVPVILMTDKYLAESRFSAEKDEYNSYIFYNYYKSYKPVPRELEDYERYELTPDGISPRTFPGQVTFLTNSYEHDEHGFSTDDARMRELMMQKRSKKTNSISGGFEIYGPKNAKITLVGWGSTKEIILEVLKDFPEYNFVHFWRPWPFPKEAGSILVQAKKRIVIEGNFSGQLADLIEKETGLKSERILKDNGRPFYREELIKSLTAIR